MKLLKIVGLTVGVGTALYLALVLILVLSPYLSNYVHQTEFNSDKWKSWKETETTMSLRWNMMSDLQDDFQLKGMTEKEIVDVLGEPENKWNAEWRYYLGMAGHGIDTGTLILVFENGKVKSYRIYQG